MNNHSANSYEATERRKMQKVKLLDIIEKPLSGEWGSEAEDGNGVLVLRTTNFTNEGIINFNSVVRRDLGNKNVDKKYLKKGDIIIEKSGGSDNQPVGRVVYFEAENNKYLFNNFTSVLRVKTDIAFPKYIFYCLFYKYKIGATRPFENKTTGLHNLKLEQYINSILITLPPIEEQRAIAEKLDKVSQLVDKRKEQLQQLDQLVKSQFIDMFGDVDCGKSQWKSLKLEQCCKINPSKLDEPLLKDDLEVSFVPMAAVGENGEFDATLNRKYADVKTGFTYFANNDVLFAKITPCMENGKGAIAKGLNNGIGFGSTEFHVLRPNTDKINSIWLFNLTKLPKFRKLAESKMTGSAGQRRVPASFLSEFSVNLPPIELQNQFVEFVERVDKLKEKVNNSLTHLNLLKQSLMQQYFN